VIALFSISEKEYYDQVTGNGSVPRDICDDIRAKNQQMVDAILEDARLREKKQPSQR